MGTPVTGMNAAEQASAESLLAAFRSIDAAERRKHASVLNYWLSIRGDKEFPPLHDLDPLEISDAGPCSVLLELISGGHDAEIRHLGETLKGEAEVERMIDAPSPSILSSIAKKLPLVAISRDFMSFEDEFTTAEGTTRCWVTLLPLSAGGAWVDYVYALVSFETEPAAAASGGKKSKAVEVEEDVAEAEESVAEEVVEEPVAEEALEADQPDSEVTEVPIAVDGPVLAVEEIGPRAEGDEALEAAEDQTPVETAVDKLDRAAAKAAPGFSKLFDSLAGLTGIYAQNAKVDPVITGPHPASNQSTDVLAAADEQSNGLPAAEPPAVKPVEGEPTPALEKSAPAMEGHLQTKLSEVRAMADEARMAKLRANAALYEGLGAAYDFALDAEDSPEEYLQLVEAQGLKIQLRAPMKPVVKLAFDGMCDDPTIKQLEAVLDWAFKQELPRGSLAERIEAAGGIARVLNGEAPAA